MICTFPQQSHSYEIVIGSHILQNQTSYLKQLASKCALITDDHIGSLYGIALEKTLTDAAIKTTLFSFPAGEQYKTRAIKESLEDQMLAQKFGRDSCIIALGGGVVTDMAGYLAATYCRGIPHVMIPTSFLGMVDASIGGKTGVNVPQGKNMIGCIYQPKKVIIDLSFLTTLPKREIANGFVEMIKHALIADKRLFLELERESPSLLALDPILLEKAVIRSCLIKKTIVEEDEKEQGKRQLLNLGHTIGHALEHISHYALSHGEAIAIGLVVEGYIAMQMGLLDAPSFARIKAILQKYQLPFYLPPSFSQEALLAALSLDKKSLKAEPHFVLLQEIGVPQQFGTTFSTAVAPPLLIDALQWMQNDLCRH